MITRDGPKVVEFNCRMGDPETQAILPVTSFQLLPLMRAVATGESVAADSARHRGISICGGDGGCGGRVSRPTSDG